MIFFDPPYATDYLRALHPLRTDATKLMAAGGLLVIEHHHKNVLPEQIGTLHRGRILKQGDSALSFYELDVESV
jgi:16S rRNA G966 N2-methylase RsmD